VVSKLFAFLQNLFNQVIPRLSGFHGRRNGIDAFHLDFANVHHLVRPLIPYADLRHPQKEASTIRVTFHKTIMKVGVYIVFGNYNL